MQDDLRHAPREFRGVHIDNSVLEGEEVEDREAILREGKQEAERLQELARSASEELTSHQPEARARER